MNFKTISQGISSISFVITEVVNPEVEKEVLFQAFLEDDIKKDGWNIPFEHSGIGKEPHEAIIDLCLKLRYINQ